MQLPSLLGHARELLFIIRSSDKPADSLIDSYFRSRRYLGSHDRRFIAETVYGTLRHLRRCELLLRASLGERTGEVREADGMLLLIATYLRAVERSTALTPEDIASHVSSASLRSDIHAILERLRDVDVDLPPDPAERIGIRYSFQDWMVRKLLEQYGKEETERVCAALNEQAPPTLRVNTLKTTVEECQSALRADGVETTRTKLSPFGLILSKRINMFQLRAFKQGLFEVQDEGSQIVSILLDPKPTERVLDACAGAGGKTLALAALMQNRGEIVAADMNAHRLGKLKQRARRAGAFNVRIRQLDALSGLGERDRNPFDAVLVDAPCSGLGTIRRNPGMKWMVSEETVREMTGKQSHILHYYASLVRSGGRITYATCTLLEEENERIVERFLEKNAGFSLIDPSALLARWNLAHLAAGPFVKLFPHRHGTDGFFCALITRTR